MAQNGKQKRKIWFSLGTGRSDDYVGKKVPSSWNPGKSRKKFKNYNNGIKSRR